MKIGKVSNESKIQFANSFCDLNLNFFSFLVLVFFCITIAEKAKLNKKN